MPNFTAADVLSEVVGMIKESEAWKNADVSVRLYQVGGTGNVFCMWYAPRRDGVSHLIRHNYCITGDSLNDAAAKVFAQMQKNFDVR